MIPINVVIELSITILLYAINYLLKIYTKFYLLQFDFGLNKLNHNTIFFLL